MEEKEEWDGPWKEALDAGLEEAMALFWPGVLDE